MCLGNVLGVLPVPHCCFPSARLSKSVFLYYPWFGVWLTHDTLSATEVGQPGPHLPTRGSLHEGEGHAGQRQPDRLSTACAALSAVSGLRGRLKEVSPLFWATLCVCVPWKDVNSLVVRHRSRGGQTQCQKPVAVAGKEWESPVRAKQLSSSAERSWSITLIYCGGNSQVNNDRNPRKGERVGG